MLENDLETASVGNLVEHQKVHDEGDFSEYSPKHTRIRQIRRNSIEAWKVQ
jgi:hypothetical protein